LIQLRADVPTDTAVKLYSEFPAHAVILMANSPSGTTSAFLRIFQTERDRNGAWLAAGNVLVNHRAPGLAAAVQSSLVVHVQGIENRKHGIMILALGETGGLSGHSVVLGKRKQIGNPDCEAIA
jgi:hypothetical protein